MRWHVYGVVRADVGLPDVRGVGAPPGKLAAMVHEDVAAVVSELGDDCVLTDGDALAHLDVLRALLVNGPVLPLRFGTEAPDEDAVREEVLVANAEDLRQRLDAVDGLVELRLDLRFDEQTVMRRLLTDDPALRELAARAGTDLDQRVQLGETVVQAVRSACLARADELVAPLLETARGKRLNGTDDPTLDRWVLLAGAAEVPDLDQTVAAIRKQAPDVRIEYVGPLPVFSFHEELTESGRRTPASRWGW